MRVRGARTLRNLGRWLRSRVELRALVLAYHRIEDTPSDPYDLCTSPGLFADHLDVLRREAHPMSLSEMLAGLRRRVLPRRAVVVTLDDGYSDSLHRAKPALEARDVPATFFVTSGLLGREPWWDALARILGSAAARSARLTIDVNGRSLSCEPGPPEDDSRIAADRILRVHRALLGWPAEAREQAIAKLREALGDPGGDPGPRGLEPEELRRLAAGRGIEIGAHSVSHPMLASLPEPAQRHEIGASKRELEELIAAPVRHFSYPNGSHSPHTRALVRECGFESACASVPGVASPRSDPFCLPRFWIGALEVDAFARWLRRWC